MCSSLSSVQQISLTFDRSTLWHDVFAEGFRRTLLHGPNADVKLNTYADNWPDVGGASTD